MIRFLLRDKTPREQEVYTIDWSPYLGQDTLTGNPTSDVREGTIVVDNMSNSGPKESTLWISGGVKGEVARAMVQITTVGNRELDAEVILGVR